MMSAAETKSPLSRLNLAAYGFLALPLAFSGLPLYLHAPDFYAVHHGVSLALLGTVLLGIRIFDAVQDPLIGFLGDRYTAYRAVIMIVSLALLAGGFFALYHPSPSSPLLWFAATMAVSTLCFSVLTINLNALGSLWTLDTHDKTRITSYREIFGLGGLLLATIAPPILQIQMDAPEAYSVYASIFLVISIVSGGVFIVWYRSLIKSLSAQDLPALPTRIAFKDFVFMGQRPFRPFLIIYGLSILASSIPAVLIVFFVRDRLAAEELTGIFLFIYFLSAIFFVPAWKYLSHQVGKYQAWMISMILAVISFVWAFTLDSGDTIPYGIICFVSGLALGAELILPPSILSDHIDSVNQREKTSSVFAALNFVGKLMLAVATGFSFWILDFYAFVPAQVNSAEALSALSITYALIPCLIKIGSILILFSHLKHLKKNPQKLGE